jgi:hypothetical protein
MAKVDLSGLDHLQKFPDNCVGEFELSGLVVAMVHRGQLYLYALT